MESGVHSKRAGRECGKQERMTQTYNPAGLSTGTNISAGPVQTQPLDLLQRVRVGDRIAEDAVVCHYGPRALRTIRQLIRDKAVVEDVYQDTFRLVLERIRSGRVRDPERVSDFICGVARNVAIDHCRRNSRRYAREESAVSDTLASPEPLQLDRLLRQEEQVTARKVLAALPSERDRSVLYRTYLAEDSREQICADLCISGLHLNQILCRARARYKKLFSKIASSTEIRHIDSTLH
jgi:RNA polymerase sigma-70 factor, ECF subfamily